MISLCAWRRVVILSVLLLTFLMGCAGQPELRPQALVDAETNLNAGANAFYNDDYRQAAQRFTRALEIYQSLDHPAGMANSHLNLAETAIAIGEYDQASQQIARLRQLQSLADSEIDSTRLEMLEIKWLSRQKQYDEAITRLEPLLPQFTESGELFEPQAHGLNALAAMARLTSSSSREDAAKWVQRFETAVVKNPDASPRYRALLMRLQAAQSERREDFFAAEQLLQQALGIYRELPHRRGIALTLQQLAKIAALQQQWEQEDQLLSRALRIHLWTLNRDASLEVLTRLVEVNEILKRPAQVEAYQRQREKLAQTN